MKKNNENLIETNILIKQISDEKITHISNILEYKFGIKNIVSMGSNNGYEVYVYDNENRKVCFQSYRLKALAMINVSEEALRLKNEYFGWYKF
jgi:hypothetical protein